MNENKHAEIFRNPVKVDCLNISAIERELIQRTKRFNTNNQEMISDIPNNHDDLFDILGEAL